jgi:hypothetical protein
MEMGQAREFHGRRRLDRRDGARCRSFFVEVVLRLDDPDFNRAAAGRDRQVCGVRNGSGPLKTAKLTAPVPDPPETDSALVAPYACGLAGAKTSGACSSRRYSKALLLTVSPKLVENTRTSPTPTAAAAPADTMICVADWLTIDATDTPHSVTFVMSEPSHRFVPLMITGYPPVHKPLAGSTPTVHEPKSSFGAGTVACPELFCPHAAIDPSDFSPSE